MSDNELIKETMMLDYSQLVMNNVYCHKEIERLNNIIKEAIEYIEQVGIYSDYGDEGIQCENDLLKILKGEE